MPPKPKYAAEDLTAAILAVKEGAKVGTAARKFNVPRTTLIRRIEEAKLRSYPPRGVAKLATQRAIDAKKHEAAAGEALSEFTQLANSITRLQFEALEALSGALDADRCVGTTDKGEPVMVADHAVRVRAAAEILDRGGMLPKVKTVRTEASDLPTVTDSPEAIRQRIEENRAQLALLEGGKE